MSSAFAFEINGPCTWVRAVSAVKIYAAVATPAGTAPAACGSLAHHAAAPSSSNLVADRTSARHSEFWGLCPRGDLNPETGEISLNLDLNSKTGGKSPDQGVHAP